MRLVVRPRARAIGLKVDPISREAVAFAPHPRAIPSALAFAQERSAWLAAQLAQLHPVIPLEPGAVIPLRGEPTLLARAGGRGPARLEEGAPRRFAVPCPPEAHFPARVQRALRLLALEALKGEVARAAAALQVTPSRIRIKDTRSRWGSCSSEGTLCFSWRVILAPPPVLRYLAAHEAAHLREMNHSSAFWALVAKADPEFRAARLWLKRNGAALHAVG